MGKMEELPPKSRGGNSIYNLVLIFSKVFKASDCFVLYNKVVILQNCTEVVSSLNLAWKTNKHDMLFLIFLNPCRHMLR